MMKRIIFIMSLLVNALVYAQTPQQMLDKAVAAMSGAMSASYSVKTNQGVMNGTIVLNGTKFRMLSKDVKCWYDGKTQWTFSTATNEVNVTSPTASELAMTNPMAAAQSFKTGYNMWKASGQIPGHYVIMLQPKVKNDIKKVYLYLNNGTNLLHYANIQMNNGNSFTITLSNCVTKKSIPASTFSFDSSLVPAGTEVVDLR